MGENANYLGPWAVGTTYHANDVVDYDGFKYLAAATSTGVEPSGDSAGTSWTIMSSELPADEPTGGAARHTVVVAAGETYNAEPGDDIFCTGNCTIVLPAPAADQPGISVISNGGSITATVEATNGATVNGAASVTVTTQYTAKSFRAQDYLTWVAS